MQRNPNSSLKPVEKPEQWGSGLEAFRHRHSLSQREFTGVCNLSGYYIGRSSVQRLLNGQAEPRFIDRVRPAIRQSIRIYLDSIGATEEQIDLELRTIFCKPEIEAMITKRCELPDETISFFGLKADPFDPLHPRKVSEVFSTKGLDKVGRQVEDAIRYQRFVAVVGEIGSGKSTLKKRVCDTVKRSNGKVRLFWPDFFNMDKVNSGSIAACMLRDFFEQPRVPINLLSRAVLLKKILAKLSDEGVRVALGFDECHHLDRRMIVALKNFWELGDGGFDRYLGVVLFGQRSFELVLSEHREIAERCQVVNMPALTKTERGDYLRHRLALVGGKVEKLFETAAVARIVSAASTPQGLGNVANAGLAEAHNAGSKIVLARFIPDSDGDPQARGMRATPTR